MPVSLQPKDGERMCTISTYFVTQALEPVQAVTGKTRGWTLQAIVDFLVRTISTGQDYPTLGVYGADGDDGQALLDIDDDGDLEADEEDEDGEEDEMAEDEGGDEGDEEPPG